MEKNWKKFENLQKNYEGVSKKIDSVKILCNHQGNIKKLVENCEEDTM